MLLVPHLRCFIFPCAFRNRAIEIPYGNLVQNYQQCKNDAYITLRNQAGIAVGNIQVVAPMVVIFLMFISYLHKWWNTVPLDECYSKAEKDSALDAFSMSLLLSRDEKLKTHSFRGNNSIIALIAEELGEHTMLSTASHKSHATNYSMSSLSMSSHSLSGSPGGSPTSRMYAKISALNSNFRSRSGSTVAPRDDVDLQVVDHHQHQPRTDGVPAARGLAVDIPTYDQEQNMSMREWIVAKKRGSLGDNGEGLNYALRGSISDGADPRQYQAHSRQGSDFNEALYRVTDLE
jgi:hypothetical protein